MLGLPQLPRTLAAAERDSLHPRVHVRVSALADLVRLTRGVERTAAIRAIARVLTDDPSAELRADAATALADAEAFEAREALLAVLSDPHLRVRQMAVLALGEIAAAGDKVVIEALEPLLQASEPALRFQALIGLYRLNPAAAAELLTRSAVDEDG
jgi:HEAT repeat protein